jgi:Tfp pilus assembly protein PilF
MYLELNQGSQAESCWQKIVADNPQSARAHMQLGRLYLSYDRPETFDIKKAEQEFKMASNINVVITAPHMHLGYIALMKGNDNEAKNFFQSVIGTDIKNVESYFLLGYLAWKEHDYIKSQQFLKQAISFHTPVKALDGTLSEGDTKDGVSHLRPINQSLFYEYFQNLEELSKDDLSKVMSDRYQRLGEKINDINSRIK